MLYKAIKGGGYYALVLENKKPAKHYIKLGIKDSLNTQITEGLSENDTLIIGDLNAKSSSSIRMGPR